MTLDTAAYDALYAKRADFVITFAAWEGVEAKERGIELRTFEFGDYGFPDFYQVVLACDSRWLAAKPELARAFVAATVRGFELAATIRTRPPRCWSPRTRASSTATRRCPSTSQQFLAERRATSATRAARSGARRWPSGRATPASCSTQGLLAGPTASRSPTAPDYEALFTNDFLP